MNNKMIIRRMKDILGAFEEFKSLSAEQLMDTADRTKVYIFGLCLDKKDENFRKGVINMIDEYRTKLPSRDSQMTMSIKYSLRNIIECFINIIELKEYNSWKEKNEN